MDLSIIIVNWHSAQYLRSCLGSVYSETKGIEFEVIVLDNASYDGSAQLIQQEFPQVIFVQSDENLGFTKGNNFAYEYSSGENLLLLNPDTEVIGSAITRMLVDLQSLPQAGAIGCRLLRPDGSVQATSIQPFPTILNQVVDTDVLKRRFPLWSVWGTAPLFRDTGTPAEVDAVCGACLMVKRHVFEKVGLLSLDYVMYGDDLDLCYRIKKAGYKTYYTNRAHVIHHGGKSSASWKEALSAVWVMHSTHKFIVKTRGRLYARALKAAIGVAAVVRLSLIVPLMPLTKDLRRRNRLTFGLAKWIRVLQWAVGSDEWAKRAGRQAGLVSNEW